MRIKEGREWVKGKGAIECGGVKRLGKRETKG